MIKRLISALFAVLLTLGAASAFAAVDANKASQAELESIKGIGPSISGKMLDERKKSNFKDWPDLVGRVKGLGDTNAAKFSTEGLTVNGQGFKGADAQMAKPAKAEKSVDKATAKPAAASTPMSKADAKAAKAAAKADNGASAAKK
jgi:competence protein ComEA